MSSLTELIAKADDLIQMHAMALGGGRKANPFYDPTTNTRNRRPHRIGEGNERSIPLSRVISPQATVHMRKVNSIKGKYQRGTMKGGTLPTVQRSGPKFIVHDGNHRLAGALKAGKRMVRALVQ